MTSRTYSNIRTSQRLTLYMKILPNFVPSLLHKFPVPNSNFLCLLSKTTGPSIPISMIINMHGKFVGVGSAALFLSPARISANQDIKSIEVVYLAERMKNETRSAYRHQDEGWYGIYGANEKFDYILDTLLFDGGDRMVH